jgi:branched-chain amino acid aminotransferase
VSILVVPREAVPEGLALEHSAMARLVNINGVIHPPDRAFISVYDRGFLYGDSVYEVMRTYQGRPFEQRRHLDRLAHSAQLIGFDLPFPLEEIAHRVEVTLQAAHQAADGSESYIRVVATRGAGEISLDPRTAEHPNLIIFVQPLKPLPPELYETGAKVQLVGVRRNSREAIDPAAKTGNYLNSVMALAEARSSDAHEAIMLDAGGQITEGASSSIFLVRSGTVITPALGVGILEGITRSVLLELARDLALPIEERSVSPSELETADEAFLTSTLREVLPVTRVGEHVLGSGGPGPITRRLREAFAERVSGPPQP